jgi:hypothetical protein
LIQGINHTSSCRYQHEKECAQNLSEQPTPFEPGIMEITSPRRLKLMGNLQSFIGRALFALQFRLLLVTGRQIVHFLI